MAIVSLLATSDFGPTSMQPWWLCGDGLLCPGDDDGHLGRVAERLGLAGGVEPGGDGAEERVKLVVGGLPVRGALEAGQVIAGSQHQAGEAELGILLGKRSAEQQ